MIAFLGPRQLFLGLNTKMRRQSFDLSHMEGRQNQSLLQTLLIHFLHCPIMIA